MGKLIRVKGFPPMPLKTAETVQKFIARTLFSEADGFPLIPESDPRYTELYDTWLTLGFAIQNHLSPNLNLNREYLRRCGVVKSPGRAR